MRIKTTTMLVAATTIAFTAGARAGTATLTGTVGDAMCGPTHMVKGDDAACTRACVKGGAKYALVVKGKAYTLEAGRDAAAALGRLANQQATVSGEQRGDTIQVASVKAAK